MKKIIQKLRLSDNHLVEHNKENLISFLRGFFTIKEHEKILLFLGEYLNRKYRINTDFNTWEEQIDAYSFIQKKDWYNGFFELLKEMNDTPNLINKNLHQPEFIEENKMSGISEGQSLNHYFINYSNMEIKIGDYLILEDKIGNDYLKTKFCNSNHRNPDWNLFEPSDKDFQTIKIYTKGFDLDLDTMFDSEIEIGRSTFGNARRLFGNAIIEIKKIEKKNNKVFAYSNNFEIDLERSNRPLEFSKYYLRADEKTTDFSSLELAIKEHLKSKHSSLIEANYPSLSSAINYWSFHDGLKALNKEWYLYSKSMNGRWFWRGIFT